MRSPGTVAAWFREYNAGNQGKVTRSSGALDLCLGALCDLGGFFSALSAIKALNRRERQGKAAEAAESEPFLSFSMF
jgi:hypothetical protein